jgi:predicted DNA-binding protein
MSEQLYDFFGQLSSGTSDPPSTHIREWVEHSSKGYSR